MKNRKVLCFLFLLAIFALFGCTKTTEKENLNSPNVQSKSEISSLTDKEFSDLGGLNDLNNPTKESFKKVKIKVNISNYKTLKIAKINLKDNWKSIFGDNYWFGSGSTEDNKFAYNYKMILHIETKTYTFGDNIKFSK